MTKGTRKFNPQDLIDEQVAQIDEAIGTIERRMKPYESLAQKKQQLLQARRALLGQGSRLTGGTGGSRLTLDEIKGWLSENPGSSPGVIAEHFGVSQSTVSSHLYRNKTVFINRDGSYWVRDPKSGLDTAADIEEDDE